MAMYRNDSLLQAGEKVTDEQLATEMKLLVNQRAINRLSRRNFLASAGIGVGAAGALVIAGCGSNSSTTPVTTAPVTTTAPAVTEVDVLNFALNLEYLEASFYLYLTTGNGLSTADMGSTPGIVGRRTIRQGALRQFCIAKNITSAAVDSFDIAVTGSTGPVFNTDKNGLNAVRTPSQVLQIVYAAAGQQESARVASIPMV